MIFEDNPIDRKFNRKDWILLVSIVAVGCLVILSMYMVDRQWRSMAKMQASFASQADDLRALTQILRQLQARVDQQSLASVAQGNSDSPVAVDNAFARAAGVAARDDFAEGDWFVRAFPVGLKTITPLVSSDVYAANVQSYVIETLLVRNPESLEWDGLLARDWKVSDDGLSIEFALRKGVVFSDGVPLTAEDIAFSYQFIMDERIAAPRTRSTLQKISMVEVLDSHRVRFVFAEPYFESLGLAGQMQILAKHFYEPYLDNPEQFNQSKGLLIGSGPYRLGDPESWTPDSGRVELIRNQRYWGPVQPSFDRMIWSTIENDSARLAAFRNSTIDAYSSKPREYQKLRDDKQLGAEANNLAYMSPTAGYSYIGWNNERDGEPTLFADQRVRKAMTLMTDRERIVEEIMLGQAEIAVSPFNPRSDQHDPAITPWPTDIAAAQALLDEAGFADRDGDGVLENEAGKALEFELVYFQDSDDTRRIVLFLKDLYARAGVSLIPKPSEWSVMIDLLDSRNFDAITLGWSSGVETDIYQMFHGSQIDGGGDNFVQFSNPELDSLIDQARAEVSEQARMPLWHKAERILHDEQPYTFLMRRKSLMFIDRRIQNTEVTRLGLNTTLVPVETYVPRSLQQYQQ
jgi:peptide/nickel transport system substrate-binding protein